MRGGIIAALTGTALAIFAAGGGPALAQDGLAMRRVEHGGIARRYFIVAPAGEAAPVPLIIGLHAGGSRAQRFARYTGLHKAALAKGFAVIFPDAVDGHWNDGLATVGQRAYSENIDDVGFLRAVVDHASKSGLKVAPGRIFVSGLANGGMLAHRVACEAAGWVGAIAPVAAAMPARLERRCRPSKPVSVLAINGTNDPLVPWRGGEIRKGFQRMGVALSPLDTMRFWASQNGCDTNARPAALPDKNPSDATTVTLYRFEFCTASATRFYKVDLGGGTWPGADQILPEAEIGKTTKDIDASTLIVDFFAGLPKR